MPELDEFSDIITIISSKFPAFVIGLFIFFIFYISGRWLGFSLGKGLRQFDKTLAIFLSRLIRILISLAGALFALKVIGVPTAPLIAILGSATIAIGLALQSSLSNIASGIMLIIFRPHEIGDFIQIEETGIMGNITNIGLFFTELQHFDGKKIILPNSKLTSANVANMSDTEARRVDIPLYFDYKMNFKYLKDLFINISLMEKRILQEPPLAFMISSINRDSCVFNIRFWVSTEDYWDCIFEVNRIIVEIVKENNLQIQPAILRQF